MMDVMKKNSFQESFIAAFNEVIGTDGKKYAEISVNGKQFGATRHLEITYMMMTFIAFMTFFIYLT